MQMKKKLALLTVAALFSVAASAPVCAAVAGGRDAGANAAARNVELVRGAARDMPLGQAIHAIVPREFTVRTAGIARQMLDEPVSWSGGRAWTEVLLELLEPYPDLAADISLSARRVTVRQVPQGARMAALQEEAAAEAAAAPRRESRAESGDTARRAPPAAVQAKPVVAAASRQQPAAHATQEATLAVMQMAIQTATQTAIQSAVQAALQNAGAPAKPAATAQALVSAAPAAPPPAPPAAPPAPAKAVPPPLPTWEILPRDRSVRAALERWTASAGWQLSWEMAVDYPVVTRTTISGTFETAVEAVAQSLERAEVPVKAVMYRGNRVLRIVAKGSE
jgi:hypothetical protein